MGLRIDLTGLRVGNLLVTGFSHRARQGSHYAYFWTCKCKCGEEKAIRRDHLREGRVISCGCILTTSYDGAKEIIRSIPPNLCGCKKWPGYCEKNGYGRTRIEGKRWSTHRLSYFLFKGPIPSGKLVCHTCDNRWCINPEHLFLGTHDENMEDMVLKRRQMHGETHHKSKLSREDVIAIRQAHADLMGDLSKEFNISKETLGNVIRKKTWRNLE